MRTKTLIICVLSFIATSMTFAQKENPRGLYKLQKFVYDDGTEKLPPFDQYKYCGNNVTLQFSANTDESAGTASFTMINNDRVPLNYTGNVPVGEDGKGIQIFNSTKKNFTLRWYSRYENHSLFPNESFLNEIYSSKKGVSPLVAEAFKMLTTKEWKSKNKMVGVWHRRGYTKSAYGNGPVSEAQEMYKIYSEKNVLILSNVMDIVQIMRGSVDFWPCTYLSQTVVQEYQHTCVIYWLNDDCFTLTWFNDGVPEIEVWDRCGLPDNMQELFGTNIDNSNYQVGIKPSDEKPSYTFEEIEENDDDVYRADGSFLYYGTEVKVRFTDSQKFVLASLDPMNIEREFVRLRKSKEFQNTLQDCKQLKQKLQLNDWGYLKLIEKLSNSVFDKESNEAVLFMTALWSASGYRFRLARPVDDENVLIMLFASDAFIYKESSWIIDKLYWYVPNLNAKYSNLLILDNSVLFDYDKLGKPVSIKLNQTPLLADNPSKGRLIQSKRYPDFSFSIRVNKNLMAFYKDYPSCRIGDDFMTRWAIIANVQMEDDLQQSLYPMMKRMLKGLGSVDAVERILNWIQTGFEFDFDDEVWGSDRAFFAEETLFYPVCDSEDRAILFSRLVRDLVGLPVALLYYPGHLAAAVCFEDGKVSGVSYEHNGKRYVVCDPTYIGANIGMEMPDCSDATLISLE